MASLRLVLVLAAVLAVPASVARADEPALAQIDTMAAEVRGLLAARAEVAASRARLLSAGQAEEAEIARLKAQAPGLARDLRLGQLLASSQERGRELERLSLGLRGRETRLVETRRALVLAYDRVLAVPGPGSAIDAQRRAEIVRARDEAAARLGEIEAQGGPIGLSPAAPMDPLEGPSELLERADRVKDDEDKLRREAGRLDKRITTLEERRRLRESAASVDDDLFMEGSPGRAVRRPLVQSAGTLAAGRGAEGARDASGAPKGPPPAGNPGDPNFGGSLNATSPSTMLRGVVDPATLGLLRRAEAGGDPELELRALKQAHKDLSVRAADLARRETELRKRAAALRNTK